MKIAICDDEKHYCKQIQECVEIYLDKHHIYGKTEIFMDGNALLEKGMLAEFDALFLDVEFGGKAQGMVSPASTSSFNWATVFFLLIHQP